MPQLTRFCWVVTQHIVSMKNQPNKHHFLPVFYLKQWAGADDRVCRYSKPYRNKVVPKRKHPAETGYINRLYAIEGLPQAEAVEFESAFLSPVDSRAAEALVIMRDEHGVGNFNSKQRTAWTRFLQSLMMRMPDDIRKLKRYFKDDWLAYILELQGLYDEFKSQDHPASFAEYMESTHPSVYEKGVFSILKRLIDHDEMTNLISSLHWSVLTFEASEYPLLTSDRPIIYTPHMQGRETHILVPISPTEVFLAVREPDYAQHIKRRSQSELGRILNQYVVEGADEFVYGIDDRQLRFVQNRMGKAEKLSLVDRLHQRHLDRVAPSLK